MEDNFKAALRTRVQNRAADFELEDAWDEGLALTDRDKWPICITLNVVRPAVALCTLIHNDTLQATKRARRRCNARRGTGDPLEAVALLRLFERCSAYVTRDQDDGTWSSFIPIPQTIDEGPHTCLTCSSSQ